MSFIGPEYGSDHYVSWHNLAGSSNVAAKQFTVHDVTLRDGEQQAGVLFSFDEKVEIARALDELGVDRIEAGMVAVSEEDRQAIHRICNLNLNAEIWTIARSTVQDIEQAIESGVAGVGIIILANDQYCKIFNWTAEQAIAKALAAAEAARMGGLKTALLLADSSRMNRDRLEQIVSAATESGHFGAIALMDTFGALSPEGARHLVKMVRSMTPLTIELHPHNDFGLATANALAGLSAGADVIHTSMIGLGERVGNTPLEEVAVAAPLLANLQHRMHLPKLRAVADLVQRLSGVNVAANKAVIGKSYSQIESGTVAAEYTRLSAAGEDLQWLFPFNPALVGADDVMLVLGKGSGVANIDAALERLGIELEEPLKRRLLANAKEESVRRHRLLSDEELRRIVEAR